MVKIKQLFCRHKNKHFAYYDTWAYEIFSTCPAWEVTKIYKCDRCGKTFEEKLTKTGRVFRKYR